VADLSQEELIRMVSKGTINYALCQENVAMVCKRSFWNIDASVLAFPLFSYGWGVHLHSDSLRDAINSWLGEYKQSGTLKKTYLSYFDNQRIVGVMQSDYFSVSGTKLSPYDKEIREYSKWINWDWRLLASLVYEESNFIPGQISSRSASGLMQLMPETAAKFGADSTSSAAQQIAAGVRYVRYLGEQLPEEIANPKERICFTLAAYNIGINRVLSVREKAEKYGRDKNRWNGHVDYFLLRRSSTDPYAKGDSTEQFPVDYKMEGFVDDIIARYYHYKNLIPE
jgi:membrane-bound lytic murein transglycosylase F